MQQAKSGDTVHVHYTGTLDDGSIFDSSKDREPLEFKIGGGQVIPGFENGVEGMSIDETKTIHIPCAEAYGELREDLIGVVPKDQFPPEITPEVGMPLQIPQPNGMPLMVTITKISENDVTLDANHPLAGKDLNFELTLVKIS